jgi:hypothetical protein
MKKSQLREYIRKYINEIRLKSGDSSKVVTPQSLIGKTAYDLEGNPGKIIDAVYASDWKKLTKYDSTGWMNVRDRVEKLDSDTILIAFKGRLAYSDSYNVYLYNGKGNYKGLNVTIKNEVRFTSDKSDKLKAFKDREGGVTLYYNQPGADWFSQVIKSDYGTLDRTTNLVNFYFWSDEKMTEFEGILDYNGIAYTKPTIDGESDIISIDKGRFDFIDIPTGPHMKAVQDEEWYNPLP